jgi:flagellar motor switch protein FliM
MNVQPHNFRRPSRLAPDLEARLQAWLKNACKLAPQLWSKHLPCNVELSLESVEAWRASDALSQIPETAIGFRLAINADQLKSLIILPRPFALALVGGAMGETVPEGADRELTAVEDSLSEFLAHHLLVTVIQETWLGSEPIRANLSGRENNPRWTRLFPIDSNVVVLTIAVQGPFGKHSWMWVLSQNEIQVLLGHVVAKKEPVANKGRAEVEKLVRHWTADLSVELGSVDMSIGQLANLKPGDVLILDQRVNEPLKALVEGREKFRVWPGQVRSRLGIQVVSVTTGEP